MRTCESKHLPSPQNPTSSEGERRAIVPDRSPTGRIAPRIARKSIPIPARSRPHGLRIPLAKRQVNLVQLSNESSGRNHPGRPNRCAARWRHHSPASTCRSRSSCGSEQAGRSLRRHRPRLAWIQAVKPPEFDHGEGSHGWERDGRRKCAERSPDPRRRVAKRISNPPDHRGFALLGQLPWVRRELTRETSERIYLSGVAFAIPLSNTARGVGFSNGSLRLLSS